MCGVARRRVHRPVPTPRRGVGGGVLGTQVEHPPFGGVFPVIQIRGVFDVDVELSCGARVNGMPQIVVPSGSMPPP